MITARAPRSSITNADVAPAIQSPKQLQPTCVDTLPVMSEMETDMEAALITDDHVSRTRLFFRAPTVVATEHSKPQAKPFTHM
jgi:hypothetical protein